MKKLFFLIAAFALIITSVDIQAQSRYTLGSDPEFKVSGTSTLHDWEMVSTEASGRAAIETDGRSITGIRSLELSLKAESLKSGTSRMDRNAYSALNTSSHPNIKFTLNEVVNITANQVTARGTLTISGKSNTVTLKTDYNVRGNRITFSGKHEITFSEYDLDAPTAMLGTVRTGEDLTLEFNATFLTTN
nr:YceI family protein [Saprospiraceae bacterium]